MKFQVIVTPSICSKKKKMYNTNIYRLQFLANYINKSNVITILTNKDVYNLIISHN